MGFDFENVKPLFQIEFEKIKIGDPIPSYVEPLTPPTLVYEPDNIMNKLLIIQKNITENIHPQCYQMAKTSSALDYKNDRFLAFLEGHQILVMPYCINFGLMGNNIGINFIDLACAALSGAHFMAIINQDPLTSTMRQLITRYLHF
jgi:hypothetical protein